MNAAALSDFEIHSVVFQDDARTVSDATFGPLRQRVRLTVFSAEVSRGEAFRRAFKCDREMLINLHHAAIPQFLVSGESDGSVFFCTDWVDGKPLTERLKPSALGAADDIIELGWQICSALQHAHNFGVVHGGISGGSILLTNRLKVAVIDFGVHRWLYAAAAEDRVTADQPARTDSVAGILPVSWRATVMDDLRAVAGVLVELTEMLPEATHPGGVTAGALRRVLQQIQKTESGLRPMSARDFQGQLGELLLGEVDTIPLVDNRHPSELSRRSIVDELFERQSDCSGDAETARRQPSYVRTQILPIVALLTVIVILLVIAGLLH